MDSSKALNQALSGILLDLIKAKLWKATSMNKNTQKGQIKSWIIIIIITFFSCLFLASAQTG